MKDKSSKLWLLLVAIVFVIMLSTSIFVSLVVTLLIRRGFINTLDGRVYFPVLFFLFLSVVIGTTITFLASHRILKPIIKLSDATKEVAKGNFGIELDELHPVREIRDMAENFNSMVRQLNSIETLRNDFIINVSHEIKTPIAAIEGYATLLREGGLTAEEMEEYTKMIIESASQLSSLTGNILKLSKLENLEIIRDKSEYRLDEQLRQVLLLLESSWSLKEHNLNIKLSPVIFYGNEELLMQAWLNLLSNAIKFTGQGGAITVSLSATDIQTVVTIADNGIGMQKKEMRHIFEKFYQGDRARSGEGNGLGLPLVRRIVDLHGGRVSVQSQLYKGSVFTVVLPNITPLS